MPQEYKKYKQKAIYKILQKKFKHTREDTGIPGAWN